MAKIIACYKWVTDEADIRINSEGSIDFSKAKGNISDYDKNAIEAAMQAAQSIGASAVALTFGTAKAKLSLKDALTRGPAESFWVCSESAEKADGAATAKVLAEAVKKIGDYRLIICAEGASDTYARQVGPRIAARLDLPCITSVRGFEIQGDVITATRKLDNRTEVVKACLPALISVLPEVNEAPIPGLKAVLDAGKKRSTEFKLQDIGLTDADVAPRTEVRDFKAYIMNRKNIIISADTNADKVKELVANLRKDGVI